MWTKKQGVVESTFSGNDKVITLIKYKDEMLALPSKAVDSAGGGKKNIKTTSALHYFHLLG